MTKTICSIYFSQLTEIRRPSYQGIFSIPVVKKGGSPARLAIKDHIESVDRPYHEGTQPNGKPFKQRILWPGELIAEDVLAHWTKHHTDMTTDCAPGLWVERDTVHLFDDDGKPIVDAEGKHQFRPATDEERTAMFAEDLAAAQERQDAWVEAALTKGDIMSEKPAAVPFIPQYCRDAVDYSGRERTWRKGLKSGDIKSCIFCTKAIAKSATKCPFCGEVVDVAGYAELKAKEEAALQAAREKLRVPPPVKNPQLQPAR